jgi:hypothetical protein
MELLHACSMPERRRIKMRAWNADDEEAAMRDAAEREQEARAEAAVIDDMFATNGPAATKRGAKGKGRATARAPAKRTRR